MELDKTEVLIGKDEIIVYLWQYVDIIDGSIPYSDEQKNKLKSDFNIGIDKSKRDLFLKKMEFLTREEVNCYLKLDLSSASEKMPRHLDDPDEYVQHEKYSYQTLYIYRIEDNSSYIHYDKVSKEVTFNFSESDLFKFFTKMYINFEIYATEYDNQLSIRSYNEREFHPCELVIWGVYNGELIYY